MVSCAGGTTTGQGIPESGVLLAVNTAQQVKPWSVWYLARVLHGRVGRVGLANMANMAIVANMAKVANAYQSSHSCTKTVHYSTVNSRTNLVHRLHQSSALLDCTNIVHRLHQSSAQPGLLPTVTLAVTLKVTLVTLQIGGSIEGTGEGETEELLLQYQPRYKIGSKQT